MYIVCYVYASFYRCKYFFHREYVVDLVGEPGNVHGPDSSINGGFLSSMPSPLQVSHLKEFQETYVDSASCCQSANPKHTCLPTASPLFAGILSFAYLEICFPINLSTMNPRTDE